MDLSALRRIERLNYILSGVLTLVALFLVSTRDQFFGLAVGAGLSSLNFTIMRYLVQRWMQAPEGRKGPQAFFMVPKMAALMVLIVLAVKFLPISAPYLAAGFSVFLVSIAIETVRHFTTPPETNGTGGVDE